MKERAALVLRFGPFRVNSRPLCVGRRRNETLPDQMEFTNLATLTAAPVCLGQQAVGDIVPCRKIEDVLVAATVRSEKTVEIETRFWRSNLDSLRPHKRERLAD